MLEIWLRFISTKEPISTRRKHTGIYATEACVLGERERRNLPMRHKPLAEGSYLFEPVKMIDLSLSVYCSSLNAMILTDFEIISMANLEASSIKIRKQQLLSHVQNS